MAWLRDFALRRRGLVAYQYPFTVPIVMYTGTLVVAAGLGGGAAGLAFVHDDIRDRARALRREFESNGGQWTPAIEQEREHLLVVDRRAYGAMVACAVGSGVFTALGVALVAAGVRDRGRTEVAPYGGAQGAGLTLRLRF